MTEEQQATFSGWAVVDVLGHQRYVGFVRTEAYGQAVMFRVDVPSLPEREYTLVKPEYVGRTWMAAGTKVQRGATPGYTKLIGAGSIYSISPCDEATAMKAVEANQPAELKVISMPEGKLLESPEDDDDDSDDDDVIDSEFPEVDEVLF